MPHPLRSWQTRPGWSEFGAPRPNGSWKTHRGFDYYAAEGTPIYGTADGGRVVAIRYNPNPFSGFGHSIRIAYPNGVETLDAHLQARTPLQLGDPVDTDTVIGAVGKTGNAWRTIWRGMRNDHHEVFVDGVRVDPIEFHSRTADDTEPAQLVQEDDDMPRVIRNTADRKAAPKYHGDVAIVSPTLLLRKKGSESVYADAAAEHGITDAPGDVRFIGLLNQYGWQESDWQAVRALDASNACMRPGGRPFIAGGATVGVPETPPPTAPAQQQLTADEIVDAFLQRLRASL